MNNNKISIAIIVILLAMCGYVGIRLYTPTVGASNPIPAMNSTQRIYQTGCANATSTVYASILNSDQYDRVIESVKFFFIASSTTGTFTQLSVGTSTGQSTSSALTVASTTFSTSTLPLYMDASQIATNASSSVPLVSNGGRIWPAGTYLNFLTNGTTPGYCSVVVNYFAE